MSNSDRGIKESIQLLTFEQKYTVDDSKILGEVGKILQFLLSNLGMLISRKDLFFVRASSIEKMQNWRNITKKCYKLTKKEHGTFW